MSLKQFHVIFIFCSITLSFGLSAWAYVGLEAGTNQGYGVLAAISFLIGLGLTWYLLQIRKKMRVL